MNRRNLFKIFGASVVTLFVPKFVFAETRDDLVEKINQICALFVPKFVFAETPPTARPTLSPMKEHQRLMLETLVLTYAGREQLHNALIPSIRRRLAHGQTESQLREIVDRHWNGVLSPESYRRLSNILADVLAQV